MLVTVLTSFFLVLLIWLFGVFTAIRWMKIYTGQIIKEIRELKGMLSSKEPESERVIHKTAPPKKQEEDFPRIKTA